MTRKSVVTMRIDPQLKHEFTLAAQNNEQGLSEAMRDAIRLYVRRSKEKRFREQADRIRANVQEEIEIMTWISENSAVQ